MDQRQHRRHPRRGIPGVNLRVLVLHSPPLPTPIVGTFTTILGATSGERGPILSGPSFSGRRGGLGLRLLGVALRAFSTGSERGRTQTKPHIMSVLSSSWRRIISSTQEPTAGLKLSPRQLGIKVAIGRINTNLTISLPRSTSPPLWLRPTRRRCLAKCRWLGSM